MTHRFFSYFLAVLSAFSIAVAASAQETSEDGLKVTGYGKTAIMANERQRRGSYDGDYHYSPAVRAGDFVFISGVVAGAFSQEAPIDKESFKNSIRRAFTSISNTLKAAGTDINHAVKMRTFHVFDSPLIAVEKVEQVKAVAEVKGEFMGEPHVAWTAVGTTALLPDAGLVEIEVVVYAPQ